jgi:hypothetical protein
MRRVLRWLARGCGARRRRAPAFPTVLARAVHGEGSATLRLSSLARSLGPAAACAPSASIPHGAASAASDPKE